MSKWGIINQDLEARQAVFFPHFSKGLCPLEPKQNLVYRVKVWSTTSEWERDQLRKRCKEDFLYYLCTFVNIFQAKEDPKPVPFLPYDFQIEAFTLLWKCLHDGQEDCRIVKPRDMGVTWMIDTLFEHAWHFFPYRQMLLGSRKEDEVDGTTDDRGGVITKAGQWSTLMGKIDFLHLHQPSWLLPRGYEPRAKPFRTGLRIANPENGSLIEGESANPDWGRGGRYFATAFDEHAHTENGGKIIGSSSQSSLCHFWFSSPSGPMTAHAMLGRAPIKQIKLNWWMHPLHADGMVWDADKGDRSRWSPWLAKELARIGYDPVLANDEIWADETQTGGAYFKAELFDLLIGTKSEPGTVRDPIMCGELDFRVDSDEKGRSQPWPIGFQHHPGGRWKLWLNFDAEGNPPRDDHYIFGIDVASGETDDKGRGASCSVIAVLSVMTGAKVGQFVTHGLRAHKFAEMVVAAARWFCGKDGNAYIIADAGAAGADMIGVVVDDYGIRENVYFRVASDGGVKPGYVRPKNAEENRRPWGSFEKMLWDGSYVERSVEVTDEMRHYNHNPTGGAPIHAASQTKEDPSGARENHGDRTTATVLGCIRLAEMKANPKKEEPYAPYGSVRHMRQLERAKEREAQLI